MRIYSIYDEAFRAYGKPLTGYDTAELIAAMRAIPLPETGTAYQPWIESLEACAIFGELRDRAYGGMPSQLGMCWGRNTKLNCLEYHRDSEINLGDREFILLLAKAEEIEDWRLDTGKVKAFRVPGGSRSRFTPRPCISLPATRTRRPASGSRWSFPAEPTRKNRKSSRRTGRTGSFGPGTSGCWPTRSPDRRGSARGSD